MLKIKHQKLPSKTELNSEVNMKRLRYSEFTSIILIVLKHIYKIKNFLKTAHLNLLHTSLLKHISLSLSLLSHHFRLDPIRNTML